MSSISTYNRYPTPGGRYYRAGTQRTDREAPKKKESRQQPAPPTGKKQPQSIQQPQRNTGFLSSLLPAGLDAGDLLLATLLLFLYVESKDEDFLIILIVVGLSMLKGDEEKT
ncbi:MAG: hypothetical protein ACI3VB_07730 [Oscillospiraceae bacterium]